MDELGRRDFLKRAGIAGGLGAAAGGILGGFPAAQGAQGPGKESAVPPEARLSVREMDYLKRWDSPTIANALERRNVRPRDKGFMSPEIRAVFPEFGPMLGYAATATIRASEPRKGGEAYVDNFEYYEYIQSIPSPRIMVIHDQDAPTPIGSFWGEVHGNLHQALGCIGVITDGGVRDLGPVRALRFHYFAAQILVSHVHVHLVDFGKPVTVGGHTVKSGDLLYGDEHGVIDVPHSLAKEVSDLCYRVYQAERPSIDFYRSADFSLEKLRERRRR
ncbi:MAG: RraA family protein [Planctomycetota bacterium]|nr:RraA family protein [Planctomycetota bacterium]